MQLVALTDRSLVKTFNPKVAGSIPARPIPENREQESQSNPEVWFDPNPGYETIASNGANL